VSVATWISAHTFVALVAVVVGGCGHDAGAPALTTSGTTSSAAASSGNSTSTAVAPAQPVPAAIEAQLRGYFSPEAFWDQAFSRATSSDCVLQGADSLDSAHAWRLPGGGLVCSWGPLPNDSWGGRVMTFSVFFDPRVDAQTAAYAVTSLLPADIKQAGSFNADNADGSKYPNGSCVDLVYSSDALAAVISDVNPGWTGTRNKVDFSLYSGNTGSDGADKPYQPDSVHLALVGLGTDGMGIDKPIHC
jgi:hypothetical protein